MSSLCVLSIKLCFLVSEPAVVVLDRLLRGVDLEDVGDTDLGDVLAVENPAGRARRGWVMLGVSRWRSGCRGDFGDRGAGGGLVGDGVPGSAGCDE